MWVPLTYQLIMRISSEISIAQLIFSLECGTVDSFTSIKSLFLQFLKREKCFSLNHNFLYSVHKKGWKYYFYTDMLVNSAELRFIWQN